MQVVKAALRTAARRIIRRAVMSSWSRTAINALYLRLGPTARVRVHREFARVFRDIDASLEQPASWKVSFGGRTVLMPLTSQRLWQEWDSAVSIVANDWEVKQTYELLLASHQRPDLFVDIGANYGTHTLLFLAAGVPSLTFEPNVTCHDYFLRACALNGFKPKLEGIALGRERGQIVLSYPPRDTWFGSTDTEAVKKLQESEELVAAQVEVRPLDEYLDRLRASKRILLKIDTEGNELAVLEGAKRMLAECKPRIIFESLLTDPNRPALYEWLNSLGYLVAGLPVLPESDEPPLTKAGFVGNSATNFMATPGE